MTEEEEHDYASLQSLTFLEVWHIPKSA